jgi:hypothetical protein
MENENRPEKVFLGKVRKVNTQYGELTKISFGALDIQALQKHANEKGWSNWDLKESQSGNHYLELNTWTAMTQPLSERNTSNPQSNTKKQTDDLPF